MGLVTPTPPQILGSEGPPERMGEAFPAPTALMHWMLAGFLSICASGGL